MKRMNFRVAFIVVGILLLAIAIFLTGILSDMRGMRADLTEDKQFTLSDAAKDILERLQVPVQLKFYVTRDDKMPTQLKNLERDISDKLRDFSAASGGNLQFTVHDPSEDEELQELLQGKGIRPFQVQSVERDEIGLKLIYSAISIAYKDNPEEILPQVLPQNLGNLEYEIVSRVYRLTQESKPVVAVFAPKPQMDPQMLSMYLQAGMEPPEMPDVWESTLELLRNEHYDVQRIELTAESPIPADAAALLVLGPQNLNERQSWEIGRALSRGVNTLMAIQTMEYNYQPGQRGGFNITSQQKRSGIEQLLSEYGMVVVPDHLFDAEHEVINIPRTQNIGGLRFQTAEPVRAPMQIAVRAEQMNRDVSITNRIDQLFYLWGSDIVKDDAKLAGLNLGSRTLFTASDKAWHMPFSGEALKTADIDWRSKKFEPGKVLGYLVNGQFPDVGGDTPPGWPAAAPVDGAAPPADTVTFTGEPAEAQLVLVGCSKIFESSFLQAGNNALLLLNSVDALALGGELIGIRSKLITQRSIKQVEAKQKLFFRFFTVALVPLLLIIFGIARLLTRRKDSMLYQENLAR